MDLKELQNQLTGLVALAEKALNAKDMEKYKELEPQISELEEQIKAAKRVAEAKALTQKPKKEPVPLPLGKDDPPEQKTAEQLAEEKKKAFEKSVHVLKYGDIDETKSAIAHQIVGQDYLEALAEQEGGFKSYLRTGIAEVRPKHIWTMDNMVEMLKDGMSVAEIKTTMVEAADVLGGYAVPPQRATEVLRRMRGLTAVRSAGALVVQTNSDSIRWLKIRGYNTGGSASDQYPTGLRGAWGSETQTPAAKNFELGMESINVEVYTYKVPMSVSLVEDATNLVDVLMQLIADTMAIDEDDAFIQGDGANKPRGLLPAGANDHSFTELASGVSADIAIDTTKKLRRQIASQYRANGRASYLWESDTAAEVETWQDGIGRFYLETTEAGEMIWRTRVYESESMPSIGSSAYPILYGDFSGYAIVERLGMSIVRFMDSNTGINTVEYHVRRRIGGDVIQPYKFAVIQCDS